jgi:hypothetical protein
MDEYEARAQRVREINELRDEITQLAGHLNVPVRQHEASQSNGADQHQVVVHVATETLRDKSAGCCEVEDGPSMSAETARRLAWDASVVVLIEDEDGEPLSVGRKTRTISPALRRFLKARDKGCRFPSCTNTRHVDSHHQALGEWWRNETVEPGKPLRLPPPQGP